MQLSSDFCISIFVQPDQLLFIYLCVALKNTTRNLICAESYRSATDFFRKPPTLPRQNKELSVAVGKFSWKFSFMCVMIQAFCNLHVFFWPSTCDHIMLERIKEVCEVCEACTALLIIKFHTLRKNWTNVQKMEQRTVPRTSVDNLQIQTCNSGAPSSQVHLSVNCPRTS